MARAKVKSDAVLRELRAFGLGFPGAHTKSPWPGHLDLAVNDKTFAYLSLEGEPLSISCKLPHTHETALLLPFTKPTAYGLGRSGWVTADFAESETIPTDMLKSWIDESYRAQAPKKLVATLGNGRPASASVPKTKKRAAIGGSSTPRRKTSARTTAEVSKPRARKKKARAKRA